VSTVFGIVVAAALVLVPTYLVMMLIRSIRDAQRKEHLRALWPNFALGIVLCALFFISWTTQAAAEWRKYVQDQRDHGKSAEAGEFLIVFGEASLQNWQSEFLEAFALVVFSAMYVHHGSGESKDGEDRIEQKVDKIIEKLGA
jgi:hypothetical protein